MALIGRFAVCLNVSTVLFVRLQRNGSTRGRGRAAAGEVYPGPAVPTWTPRSVIAIVLVAFASLTLSTYEFRVWNYSDVVGGIYGQHTAVLQGAAGNPVQYRALPEYVWDWLIRLQTWRGSGDPIYTSAEALRYSQNLLLFFLAYAWYRRLGLSIQSALVGMGVFTLMLTAAVAPNWLRMSSNFDASFYLIAGLVIVARKDLWIIPLSALAALNREASGFIPFMLLSARWSELRFGPTGKRVGAIVGGAVVVWLAVYIALRALYPPQPLVTDVGTAALRLNLLRETSWVNLFSTFGIIPIVALLGYRWWPPILRTWFWLIVPLWIVVHVLFSLINETLLFTEPVALVLLPASIYSVVGSSRDEPVPSGRDRQRVVRRDESPRGGGSDHERAARGGRIESEAGRPIGAG